ncbi:18048_t:CDS:1, partial [Dentiscutata erythropus]
MNQKSIFLFILLIPLDKRETQFQDCSDGNFASAKLIHVAMSPDPLVSQQSVTFTVSGSLDYDIKDNGLIVAQLDGEGNTNIDRFASPAKSTKAGQPFSMTTRQHTLPDIPLNYRITVFIVNPTPQHNNTRDIIGCATAKV